MYKSNPINLHKFERNIYALHFSGIFFFILNGSKVKVVIFNSIDLQKNNELLKFQRK